MTPGNRKEDDWEELFVMGNKACHRIAVWAEGLDIIYFRRT